MKKIEGFEALQDALKESKVVQCSKEEIQERVKAIFDKSVAAIKQGGIRPELEVGKIFLQTYFQEKGADKMKVLLSKLSILTDKEGFDYLVEIGIIRSKKINTKHLAVPHP